MLRNWELVLEIVFYNEWDLLVRVFGVRARVWNPSRPGEAVDVELIVDTGATYTVLPADILGRLGVAPIRTARLRLADGGVVEKPIGEVGIEVEGV